MVKYRRHKIKAGCYFFTVTLKDRNSQHLIKNINALRASFFQTKKLYPFTINAIVILPDHLHTIWTLPTQDDDFSIRWKKIKTLFTQNIKNKNINIKKNHRDEYNVWQNRFWEHAIRDEEDMINHVNYIHYNPVKHNLIQNVKDWPYSSFHRYVENKILPPNWAEYSSDTTGRFGE